MNSTVYEQLVKNRGYFKGSLSSSSDLSCLRSCAVEHFSRRLGFQLSYSDLIDSPYLSRMSSLSMIGRTLERDACEYLCGKQWMTDLMDLFDMRPIDAYGLGYPSLTLRLTRPFEGGDIRPVHKDYWFWEVANRPRIVDRYLPKCIQSIKLWIALEIENGLSGIMVSPYSQLELFTPRYETIFKDNIRKPSILESDIESLDLSIVPMNSGDYIVFGEELVHGGALNRSTKSRISIEVAFASERQNYWTVL